MSCRIPNFWMAEAFGDWDYALSPSCDTGNTMAAVRWCPEVIEIFPRNHTSISGRAVSSPVIGSSCECAGCLSHRCSEYDSKRTGRDLGAYRANAREKVRRDNVAILTAGIDFQRRGKMNTTRDSVDVDQRKQVTTKSRPRSFQPAISSRGSTQCLCAHIRGINAR